MSDAAVRPADLSDAAEIARIQRDTWHAAYEDLLGKQALAQLDATDLAGTWSETIDYPGSLVYVATEGEFTVGFCVAGRAPEDEVAQADGSLPEDAETTGLIATLLVEPRWGRRGHGSRLLAAVAELAGGAGARSLEIWLPEGDGVSPRFYESAGWAPDGWARTLDTGDEPLREVRWHTTLDDGSAP
jgi:GNAT superfamily N-acetyltransferase